MNPAPTRLSIGNRIAPPRFLLFLGVLVLSYAGYRLSFEQRGWLDGIAVAFDLASLAFLASLGGLVRYSTPDEMRSHAAANDANRVLVLLLTTLLTAVAMAAIIGELDGARNGDPGSVVRLVGTLILVWLFANAVYALHYAHAFYASATDGGDSGGLEFPGTQTPDYHDFAYFAFTLGMTFQTSDVQITRTSMRRIVLLHTFGAFLFNIGLIAFAINVLGG
ncbi:MAG: DUF1345 domain-containing protein [Porphyrobacter sp.]|nr:DUF1345 domain-containing protein [Porphyrobacter sp.]